MAGEESGSRRRQPAPLHRLTMSTDDPTKRVPKSLDTEAKLFGRYTLADVGVGLGPAVLVVLALQVLLPPSVTVGGVPIQSFTLPLAGIGLAVGALVVYLTPRYSSSLTWLGTLLRFHRRDRSFPHDAATTLTGVDRVHPQEGVIERTDGGFVGMVQVSPPSMALATPDEWQRLAGAYADFCNTVLEFPVQFYSTTEPFPVEAYLDQYANRLADGDVRANPELATLIDGYVEWFGADLGRRRMTLRDHYVVVPVRPEEVRFERESLLQQLTMVPLLGALIEHQFAPGRIAQRCAMVQALDERLRRVERGLRDLEGCHASRVPVEDAARLVGEFWAGDHLEFGDMRAILRTRPIIGGVE